MTHEFYFGRFSAYEDYYAIGESKAKVKAILWKMYVWNCYDKPTKEDKQTFEEEVWIEKIEGVQSFGYNTKYGNSYTVKSNRLIDTDELTRGAEW